LHSEKLGQTRAVHVQESSSLHVLYFVIFPHFNFDLPFFGADLATLRGSHLSALDMQPLFGGDADYQAKYTAPIEQTFQAHQPHLPWGGDFPEEAKQFFSPRFLWTRPKQTEVAETRVFAAFKDYLAAYLDLVDRAEPMTSGAKLDNILQAQLRYLRYRGEKDPARRMFKRFYGQEWTQEYIHGFLFDLERKLPQLISNKN
jgi:phycoerythrobilin:ferredoxin oxidoreductase